MKTRVIENLTRSENLTYDAEYFHESSETWVLINWEYDLDLAIDKAEEYANRYREPKVMWES